ncbi:hypothetical protein SedNR2807_01380 [Citrobacter sedlakii]
MGFAQFTRGDGNRFFLCFQLRLQGCALLLLLAHGALFGGDIRLDGFELIAVIRVGGKGAQQYASAQHAGVNQGSD